MPVWILRTCALANNRGYLAVLYMGRHTSLQAINWTQLLAALLESPHTPARAVAGEALAVLAHVCPQLVGEGCAGGLVLLLHGSGLPAGTHACVRTCVRAHVCQCVRVCTRSHTGVGKWYTYVQGRAREKQDYNGRLRSSQCWCMWEKACAEN